jgi:HEAT repeat protein
MNDRTAFPRTTLSAPTPISLLLLTAALFLGSFAHAQDAATADGSIVGPDDQPVPVLSLATTPEQKNKAAWKLLSAALADAKRPQTRIQGLAALGMLRSPQSEKMIVDAMHDSDLDVRTAAALAAGQTKDRNMTTPLRNLLDDKEPQVAFTAAVTLWKMNDKSGEDILMAVVDGERSANPTLMHGTEHTISSDLHNPSMLARIGAMQGAAMLLGPFGFGITAFEYIHKSGGDLSRVTAIEELSEEHTEPVHKELIAALGDKDPAVRAAASKALVIYRDKPTATAVYALLVDPKQPVRLTAAAAYLRTTGTPGPPADLPARSRPAR